jgi:phage shock protein C
MIAGVAGGLARYLDIDPTIVRVVLVVLALAGSGLGVLIYLALWLIMPEEGSSAQMATPEAIEAGADDIAARAEGSGVGVREPAQSGTSARPGMILGVALIVAGVLFLLRNLGVWWFAWLDAKVMGPAMIILIGLLLLFRPGRRS